MQYTYLIGIDEAGRGPLAGPVAVGVACVRPDFSWNLLPGVDDSKKLSEKKREQIYTEALALQEKELLTFAVGMVHASVIDRIGIVGAIRTAMELALNEVMAKFKVSPESCFVKLDGSLKAPDAFLYQETIIKGDTKEKIIGLASIAAKVTRDRHMYHAAKKEVYKPYLFDEHKGYGTKAHCRSIVEYGLSDMHRRSFCRKLIAGNTVV